MAQFFLGQMYRKGEGVARNPDEAVLWYKKSAEQHNRLAQYNLGWMFDFGEGVDQNPEEAISWYAKAARQGDLYAPFNIGALYYAGRDLPRDFEQAAFWFEVAVSNGNEKGRKWLDKIMKELSPEQIGAIRERLEAWNAASSRVEAE